MAKKNLSTLWKINAPVNITTSDYLALLSTLWKINLSFTVVDLRRSGDLLSTLWKINFWYDEIDVFVCCLSTLWKINMDVVNNVKKTNLIYFQLYGRLTR